MPSDGHDGTKRLRPVTRDAVTWDSRAVRLPKARAEECYGVLPHFPVPAGFPFLHVSRRERLISFSTTRICTRAKSRS